MIEDNKKSFWTNKRITAIAAMIVAVTGAVSVGVNAVINHITSTSANQQNHSNLPVQPAGFIAKGGDAICNNTTGVSVNCKAGNASVEVPAKKGNDI